MTVESWKIETEEEADSYLRDLLSKPEYRSMDEVQARAQRFVPDDQLRAYFINKGREILGSYGVR